MPAAANLPGTRKLAKQFNTGNYTIYIALEDLKYSGILESRPQSGFYVSAGGGDVLFPYISGNPPSGGLCILSKKGGRASLILPIKYLFRHCGPGSPDRCPGQA